MGGVWRAQDEKLRRDVALKVLPPELIADAERRRRLVHEARAEASVNHLRSPTHGPARRSGPRLRQGQDE